MTRPTRRATSIFACLVVASTAGAAGPASADDQAAHGAGEHAADAGEALGTVDFGVSCSAAVQPAFDRGLSFLHHMMYEQARAAFEGIVESDPDCAMAHWGVATTLFQPLWPTRPSADDLMRGWEEIQTARDKEPATERERQLVAATEAFFRDPETADWWTRIERWADAMEVAYRVQPEDPDIAALYALSRLALAPTADDRAPLHAEAETVLRGIYDQVPTHPGAVHYTIHANDATGRADRSLDIVKSYGEIAHALHMPSHIFVRLGDWPGVVDWNRRSADAALKHPAGDAVSHHYLHAADYLLYAFLQRGEDERAAAVLEEAMAHGDQRPSSARSMLRRCRRGMPWSAANGPRRQPSSRAHPTICPGTRRCGPRA